MHINFDICWVFKDDSLIQTTINKQVLRMTTHKKSINHTVIVSQTTAACLIGEFWMTDTFKI